jgi:hypothetical protein
MLIASELIMTSSHTAPDAWQIRWPARFEPSATPIFVSNRREVSAPASAVWAWLVRARLWPTWYPNSHAVRIENGGDDLHAAATFRWRTFGVSLVSRVREFVPGERLAWDAVCPGVVAYHAWLIIPTERGCEVLTEETQAGWLARLGAWVFPRRMSEQHQIWLDRLAAKAEAGLP